MSTPEEDAMTIVETYWAQLLAACDHLPEGLQDAGRQYVRDSMELGISRDRQHLDLAIALQQAVARWRTGLETVVTAIDEAVLPPEVDINELFREGVAPLLEALHGAYADFNCKTAALYDGQLRLQEALDAAFCDQRQRFLPKDHERLLKKGVTFRSPGERRS